MGNSQEGDCVPLVLDDAQTLINLDTKKFRICVLISSIVGAEVANQDNWNSTCHNQLLHLFQVSIDLQVQMNHKPHTNQLNNWEDAYLFSLPAKLYFSIEVGVFNTPPTNIFCQEHYCDMMPMDEPLSLEH